MPRGLFTLAILCASLAAGCVDAVQNGLPPLVQGCSQDSDCPAFFICNGGSCEQWQCLTSCDCPSPSSSFGCLEGGSDGGLDVEIGGGLDCGLDAGPGTASTFCFCARGAAPIVPDAGC